MDTRLTRKQFLNGATKSLVAASVGVVGGAALAEGQTTRQARIMAASTPSYSWPWPYTTLDAEDIRARGHKSYYDGGCGYGAFNAIVSALAEKIGEPFTLMPTQAAYYGSGGGAGWGTLCGAINGSALAISLVVDRTNASTLVSELMGWYTNVAFPSDISNQRAAQHTFLINRMDKVLPQTSSDSPLCHISVSRWSSESQLSAASPERAERCARLTGDVAAQAVTLLNQFAAKTFKATFVASKSVTDCLGCHNTAAVNNVVSSVKMDCQQCHTEDWEHWWTLPGK